MKSALIFADCSKVFSKVSMKNRPYYQISQETCGFLRQYITQKQKIHFLISHILIIFSLLMPEILHDLFLLKIINMVKQKLLINKLD